MRISDWSSDVCSSDLAGYRAFLRTMEVMRESGISPVGGGKNIVEALAPVYLESNGVKVAFVGCTAAMLPGTHAGRRTPGVAPLRRHSYRSEEHTSELPSLMRRPYAVICLTKKT